MTFDPGNMRYRINLIEIDHGTDGVFTKTDVSNVTVWASVKTMKNDEFKFSSSKQSSSKQVEILEIEIGTRANFQDTKNEIEYEGNRYNITSLRNDRENCITTMHVSRSV